MENQKESICDRLIRVGIAGQPEVLAKTLAAGVPLVYTDEHGQLVQMTPEGKIEKVKPKGPEANEPAR